MEVQFLMKQLACDPQNIMRKYRSTSALGRRVAWNNEGTPNQRFSIPVTDVAAWIDANLLPAHGKYLHGLPTLHPRGRRVWLTSIWLPQAGADEASTQF
jgi:hypothetical protein